MSDIEKRKADIAARAKATGTVKLVSAPPPAKKAPSADEKYAAYKARKEGEKMKPASREAWDMMQAQLAKNAPVKVAPKVEKAPAPKEVSAPAEKVSAPAKAKPAKTPVDPNALTVSDIAREMGIEPKVARARLRKDGTRATDGRWPTVTRDSDEHKALIAKLAKVGNEEAVKAATKKSMTPHTTAADEASDEDGEGDEASGD